MFTKFLKLRDAKVEIVVLVEVSPLLFWKELFGSALDTHAYASGVCADIVQDVDHVTALCDRALERWIVGISGEEGQQIWLSFELFIISVVVTQGLKSRNTSARIFRAGLTTSIRNILRK